MSLEALLLVGVILLLLVLLALVLTRKPASDPTLPLLQAAQERQATALATTREALSGEISRQKTELSLELSGFTTEQTRALNAALLKQTESLAAMEKALLERLTADAKSTQEAMSAETARSREVLDKKLTEMRETSEKRLAEIQKSVNEQLTAAVEKQMNDSFNRVIDQFTAVQKAMGDVQAVTAQIGDIKRLFGNVKTRGGWGETQVKAVLDDVLPDAYEVNVRLREGSADSVEFAVVMPTTGEARVLLPVDAKFPIEDYARLLDAWDAADPVAETAARKALEIRIRGEAKKIAEKYIIPPRTVEFAVMYLPTEGLYAEVARIPGLIDDIGRKNRVLVLGPTLLPALLRTIHLGHVTLALSKNAESVRELLSMTKAEMIKMNGSLDMIGKRVGSVSTAIGEASKRARIIATKLKSIETMPDERAALLLGPEAAAFEEDEEA